MKHHLQLQNDIKNDHAKGVGISFPTTVALAMQTMNDFTLVIMETIKQASMSRVFTQGRKTKKHSKD